MKPRGALNVWKCDACGQFTGAIHVDEGVTPMFLACRRTPGCTGTAVSAMYPADLPIPLDVLASVRWEWARASTTQLKRWRRDRDPMYEHCTRGGLVIRPITADGDKLLAELAS